MAVECFVSQQRTKRYTLDQRCYSFAPVGLPWQQEERRGIALGIHIRHGLRGQPAAGAADGANGLMLSPFAPEAFWGSAPRTPAIEQYSRSGSSLRASHQRSNPPLATQQRKRLSGTDCTDYSNSRSKRVDPARAHPCAPPGEQLRETDGCLLLSRHDQVLPGCSSAMRCQSPPAPTQVLVVHHNRLLRFEKHLPQVGRAIGPQALEC